MTKDKDLTPFYPLLKYATITATEIVNSEFDKEEIEACNG